MKNQMVLQLPGEVSSVGLRLPASMSFEVWAEIGGQLQRAEHALMWWLGDWWLHGERNYGEAAAQAAPTGYSAETLRGAAWVADRIEFVRRRTDLSFTHHHEVAGMPQNEQDALLKAAAEGDWSVKEIRQAARRLKITSDLSSSFQLPPGVFEVIVIDPPWPYDEDPALTYDQGGHRASTPYPSMSLEQIQAIDLPAAGDCILWLWTTHKFMRHAFPILDGWGFEDKAILTWTKNRMGLGRWLRSQSEFCIMAVKGSPVITLTNQTTVIEGPMREHSRKPDEFYAMVDSLCPGRKLDYFSREPREGWEQFGNDEQKFAA